MRILGIDYGRRRLGLALSDADGVLASPLPVYKRRSPAEDLVFLVRLAKEKEVERIVVGLPLNMDGSTGKMAQEVVSFGEAVAARTALPVTTFDERLTSVEAERVLVQANLSRKRRRTLRDSLSAVIILQGYLERLRKQSPPSGRA